MPSPCHANTREIRNKVRGWTGCLASSPPGNDQIDPKATAANGGPKVFAHKRGWHAYYKILYPHYPRDGTDHTQAEEIEAGLITDASNKRKFGWLETRVNSLEAILGRLASDLIDQILPKGKGLLGALIAFCP